MPPKARGKGASGGKGAGGGKGAAKRKAAEPPAVIVLSDISDDDGASRSAGNKPSKRARTGGRGAGGRGGRRGAAAPPPTVQALLGKLDELQHTQHEGGGQQKAAKRVKPKKSEAKGAPARGWSKGTGFGGSYESSRRDEEFQERARAREVRCVSCRRLRSRSAAQSRRAV
jgi:hypothetical protein